MRGKATCDRQNSKTPPTPTKFLLLVWTGRVKVTGFHFLDKVTLYGKEKVILKIEVWSLIT